MIPKLKFFTLRTISDINSKLKFFENYIRHKSEDEYFCPFQLISLFLETKHQDIWLERCNINTFSPRFVFIYIGLRGILRLYSHTEKLTVGKQQPVVLLNVQNSKCRAKKTVRDKVDQRICPPNNKNGSCLFFFLIFNQGLQFMFYHNIIFS